MNVTDGDNCAHTCVQSLPEGIHAVVRVKSCGKSCLVRQMRTNLLPRAASLLLHRKVALKIPASESCDEKDFQMQSDKQLPLWRLGGGGLHLQCMTLRSPSSDDLRIASVHTQCRMQCALKWKAWLWRRAYVVGDQRSAMCNYCLFLIKVFLLCSGASVASPFSLAQNTV